MNKAIGRDAVGSFVKWQLKFIFELLFFLGQNSATTNEIWELEALFIMSRLSTRCVSQS